MQKKHYEHNIYMAEIGHAIVNDKVPLTEGSRIFFSKNVSYQFGVKEIIGLYLLIPYINNDNDQLKYDGEHEQISIYNDDYICFEDINGNKIKMKNLRDTICHSFVSCDIKDKENPYIVFDDRIIMNRIEHDKLKNTEKGGKCCLVRNDDVLRFLKNAYEKIIQNNLQIVNKN